MRGVVSLENRALTQEEALDIIRDAEYGVLATVDEEGRPSATALNHILLADGCLYLHCGVNGEKMDNIRRNPQVSYFVTGLAEVDYAQFVTFFRSAVVHGIMSLVEDVDEKSALLHSIVDRFSDGSTPQEVIDGLIEQGLDKVSILKLTPEHITGKARSTL